MIRRIDRSPEALMRIRQRFAENMRSIRKREGISHEKLAALSGLHRTEISLLERCKRTPVLETIVAISRGLGLSSPVELLEGIGEVVVEIEPGVRQPAADAPTPTPTP
ncbi:MAG TPA: helix-turn-helix transcriptional regulator [Solirubrobacteraceae bacterium]|nr:helix-turn-helix transcriptional regulator [Solirubrobacteraceae bacterium]